MADGASRRANMCNVCADALALLQFYVCAELLNGKLKLVRAVMKETLPSRYWLLALGFTAALKETRNNLILRLGWNVSIGEYLLMCKCFYVMHIFPCAHTFFECMGVQQCRRC